MASPAPDLLLITDDAGLSRAVAAARPATAALRILADLAAPLPPRCADLWIDLDSQLAADRTRLVAIASSVEVQRRVYFHGSQPPEARTLPPGLFIRKPAASALLHVLWSGVQTGAVAGAGLQRGISLPAAFIDEFHRQDLRELCHALAVRAPAWLGHSDGSIYLLDAAQRRLTLAETSSARKVAMSVRLDDMCHPFALSIARRQPAVYDNWSALCRASRYIADECADPSTDSEPLPGLIAPLAVGPQIAGLLHLTGRTAQPAPDAIDLDAALRFLARALAYARRHAQVLTDSRIDGLTGLLNQRGLTETLATEIGRARRFGSPLSLIMLDVDELKTINDRFGHAAGDSLLRHIAGKVRAALRQIDAAARVGGDEFVIVVPSSDATSAQRIAERILTAMRDDAAVFGDERVTPSASLGVAQWQGETSVEQFLRRADAALYGAKHDGKNRVVCAAASAASIETSATGGASSTP